MTRSPLLLIFALGLQACGQQETSSAQPDIILLTVDTLRTDNVSAYNPNSRARTTHIDSLAAEGIRFERAYSPISVTGPAFCSMHTGRRPGLHGVVLNIFRGDIDDAHLGSHHHATVTRKDPSRGPKAVAIKDGSNLSAVGKGNRRGAVPGLQQEGVVLVVGPEIFRH